MKKYIVCLARVFSKEQYAKDFVMEGKFRCNTLKFFKNYKEEAFNNIGDIDEGILMNVTSQSEAKLKIKAVGTDDWHELNFVNLKSHSKSVLTNNIFCMYAPNIELDNQYSIEEVEQIIRIQEDAEKLGEYLVIIIKPEIFFERLRKEVVDKKKFTLKRGLVNYVDMSNSFHIKDENAGFLKSNAYEHQKEYRIMLDDGKDEDLHIDLEIGSLEDISFIIPTRDFNTSFKLENKEEFSEE